MSIVVATLCLSKIMLIVQLFVQAMKHKHSLQDHSCYEQMIFRQTPPSVTISKNMYFLQTILLSHCHLNITDHCEDDQILVLPAQSHPSPH